MLAKLRDALAALLRPCKTTHLALSCPDGPWASVIRFISVDLDLYLIEPRASDLVFYIENAPQVVLSFSGSQAEPEQHQQPIAQIFGIGRVLAPHELSDLPDGVREAYHLKNRQFPGVYVVIEVRPRRVYRFSQNEGFVHRDTIDFDDLRSGGIGRSVQ
jgi:hypothetical protein